MSEEPEISTTSRKTVYENKWMRVREDGVVFPDGAAGIFGIIEKPDFALVVPIHADGRIELVEQYRYPVGRRLWEFPMGALEDDHAAPPEFVAATELREETGLVSSNLELVHRLLFAPGMMKHTCHIFTARGLTRGSADRDAGEQSMRTGLFEVDELKSMILDGTFPCTVSTAAFGILSLKGLI